MSNEDYPGVIFPVPYPPGMTELPDLQKLTEWLTGQGFNVSGVSLSAKDQTIRIHLLEPSQQSEIEAIIASYVQVKTPFEQRLDAQIAAGRPIIKTLWQKPISEQTNMEKAFLAVVATVLKNELE